MTNEYRVFGPPGCGKTTFLERQVKRWATEYGPDGLFVASFTKTAAAEVAGRDLPIRREQVGTLHSFCFRSLGLNKQDVAESHVSDFNDAHPGWQLSAGRTDAEDIAAGSAIGSTDADAVMQQAQSLRARQIPREAWPTRPAALQMAWDDWCTENGYTDFTGMIEGALDAVPVAPGSPRIGLFDEAQDFTPLELALVRKWGAQMETFLIAGDDDQCIYGFKGATPDVFLDPPVDDDHRRVLSQSYRVPATVHGLSQAWVAQLSRREPKAYAPRVENDEPVIGSIGTTSGGMHSPQTLVERVARQADDGKTVMILASCSYMLRPILAAMRREGVPFKNLYRTARGDWNPLARGSSRRRMPVDRLLGFLRPEPGVWDKPRMWSWGEAAAWCDLLRSKGLMRTGAKTWLSGHPTNAEADIVAMHEHVWSEPDSETVMALEDCNLEVLYELMLASKRDPYLFPLTIARKRGKRALVDEPRITVGTIHSVKGGQADVVYLLPDVSMQGYHQWSSPLSRDEVVRQFYVGMTRARESLVVCEGARRSVPLDAWVRKAVAA
jgi:DNA helicase-2/ATP-dependent DNA helicase PcrA